MNKWITIPLYVFCVFLIGFIITKVIDCCHESGKSDIFIVVAIVILSSAFAILLAKGILYFFHKERKNIVFFPSSQKSENQD